MRKTFILVSLLVFQISFSQDVYLSAKTGVNISDFVGANTEHFLQRSSYHLGIAAEFSFTDLFSLQIESNYSAQGVTSENINYAADYISFPLLVKVYATELFSLDAGIQYAYLINDQYKQLDGITHSLDLDKSDISIIGGIGIKTRIPLFFQARYLMGVTEIDKNDNWRSKVFQFSVGYRFL
jgi:hypothetical protein